MIASSVQSAVYCIVLYCGGEFSIFSNLLRRKGCVLADSQASHVKNVNGYEAYNAVAFLSRERADGWCNGMALHTCPCLFGERLAEPRMPCLSSKGVIVMQQEKYCACFTGIHLC